ncbi:MAG: hypothetical protein NT150_01470 [Bacteroidetes bacterium]|nr:hypothetical protein [Bacteroidota bacterium]
MKSLFYFLMFSIALHSCVTKNMDVENFIEKYDQVNFDVFANKSIYYRSAGASSNSSIYFVNMFKGNCSPYVVEVDNDTKKIIDVRNELVLVKCAEYFTNKEIEVIMSKFLELKLCFIQVDIDGNVYINPSEQESPVFLKKSKKVMPKDISQFALYKGNWYVRKTK